MTDQDLRARRRSGQKTGEHGRPTPLSLPLALFLFRPRSLALESSSQSSPSAMKTRCLHELEKLPSLTTHLVLAPLSQDDLHLPFSPSLPLQLPSRFLKSPTYHSVSPQTTTMPPMHSPLPVLHPVCSLGRGVPAPIVSPDPSPSPLSSFSAPPSPPSLAPCTSPSPSSASTHTVHAPIPHHSSQSSLSSSTATHSFLSPARVAPPLASSVNASRSSAPPQSTHGTLSAKPSSYMLISPPGTPTPGSQGGAREEDDREGVHGGVEGKGVDGIEYRRGWLDSLQVLDTVGGTSVRAISAADVSPFPHGIRTGGKERGRAELISREARR